MADPIGQTVADGVDGGLKTLKKLSGSQADHAAAIRATIPFQPEGLLIAIKKGRNKPVAPDPAPAARTPLGFRPQEIPTRLEKLLDSPLNKDYQRSVFGGIYPSAVSGARVSHHSCPILSWK
jgi:hypothetical protein